jgi:hypothetical protein
MLGTQRLSKGSFPLLPGPVGMARLSRYRGPIVAMLCWCGLTTLVVLEGFAPPTTSRHLAVGPQDGLATESSIAFPAARSWPDSQDSALGSRATAAADGIYPRTVMASGGGYAEAVAAAAGSAPDPEPNAVSARGEDSPAAERHAAAIQNPAATPPEILIRHRLGSAAGHRAAQQIAEEARRAGIKLVEIRATAAVPKGREVRYLQAEDVATAERLAARFRGRWGNAWRVREMGPVTAHRLEIWLPHR